MEMNVSYLESEKSQRLRAMLGLAPHRVAQFVPEPALREEWLSYQMDNSLARAEEAYQRARSELGSPDLSTLIPMYATTDDESLWLLQPDCAHRTPFEVQRYVVRMILLELADDGFDTASVELDMKLLRQWCEAKGKPVTHSSAVEWTQREAQFHRCRGPLVESLYAKMLSGDDEDDDHDADSAVRDFRPMTAHRPRDWPEMPVVWLKKIHGEDAVPSVDDIDGIWPTH
jgi:hypothetical protein